MADNSEPEISLIKKIPIVFLLGHTRSGTTLLQSILNSHTNAVAPPEFEFIVHFYARFGKIKHLTKADITEFIDALYLDATFSLWLLDKEILSKKLLATAVGADFPTLCKTLIYLTGENKTEVKLLSDKNPINSLFVGKLMKIFPDAKFIHIIRDPRDSVFGHIRRLAVKNPFFLARRWQLYNAAIEKFKRKYPDKFFTIKYEDMVKDMDGALISLSSFLNNHDLSLKNAHSVPEGFQSSDKNKFLEKMPEDKKNAFFNKYKLIHESLAKPVNTSNIDKWKKEMNPHDIAVTEIITGKFASKYGYKVEPGKREGVAVSKYRLLKSKIIFFLWELFTRWRFDNYKFNTRHKAKLIQKTIDNMVK